MIIFDAYGTLINTGEGSINATKVILRKNNLSIDAKDFYSKWKAYHKNHIDSLTSFKKEADIFLEDLVKLYHDYDIKGNPNDDVKIMLATLGVRKAFPETLSVLKELGKKYLLYIGSTSDDQPLHSDILRNGIKVDGCFTSESLKVYKPQKEFYLKILKQIDKQTSEVIFVGDSQIDDVMGPNSVGMKTVWVNRKNEVLKEEVPKPDYMVADLTGLLNIL